jgi:cytidylate kinase
VAGEKGIVVAIDGPAGAGKSTVSRRVAQELSYRLLDTGAIYRAVALLARRRGVAWEAAAEVAAIAASLDIDFRWEDDKNHIYVAGEDVSQAIRTPEVSQGASVVSAHPPVRAALLELQRQVGAAGGVVAEGRDIGTVVFPAARAKFFLTASAEERARRRHAELEAKGVDASLEDTLAEMVKRDERDSSRDVAPLKPAEDAVLVDSSTLSIDQVVSTIVNTVRERL